MHPGLFQRATFTDLKKPPTGKDAGGEEAAGISNVKLPVSGRFKVIVNGEFTPEYYAAGGGRSCQD